MSWFGAAVLAVGAASASCNKSSSEPARAIASKQPLTDDGHPNPSAEDRCPMCAMRVADHPEWAGAIVLANGTTYYTCSVRCTIATSVHADKFLGVPATEIARVRVPDYLHKGKSLDADSAWYVVDSDVRGPMGLELVPTGTQEEARIVVDRHGGRILRRPEITPDLLADLKKRSKAM